MNAKPEHQQAQAQAKVHVVYWVGWLPQHHSMSNAAMPRNEAAARKAASRLTFILTPACFACLFPGAASTSAASLRRGATTSLAKACAARVATACTTRAPTSTPATVATKRSQLAATPGHFVQLKSLSCWYPSTHTAQTTPP